uniref:Cysteine sulfinic acid decarboxylase n=1 Tax=Bos indicus x Bos taurus TaxID=30522 RepID=A0A4W2HS86_BOBOX
MGSSALVCEEEGAFSRVPPPPPSSFSGLAGRGDSPLFLLQLGLGQSREKLPSPLYPRVCQTVHGIGACRPGGGWEWLLDRPRVRSRGDQEICRSCHSGSPACHLSSPRNPWPGSQSLVLLGGEIRRAKLQFAKLPLPLPLATTPSFPVTGGSISNMYAVNLARYQRYPDCKQRGLRALPPLALFTSKECHYSIKKGAAFLGLGTDSVRVVKADERGKMIPEDLERQISLAKAEGAVPFLVSATSGTTVLGAFDPLEAIADVCQHHGLWLHVDAAWGGSVLLSQTHRHLLAGIQRADSVAWNPHKLLSTGLQCSALLLRDTSNLLKRCHGSQASYLFQQDKFYDVALDTGDKVVQCGRRVDCLKLWLMWKAQGEQGLQRRVDQAFALARYLVEELKKREGFELVMEPEFVNVCFWFVPPSLRGKKGSPDYSERLSKVAPILKERMVRKGSMMIGYQPHGTRSNFFRMVVANPALTRADMDFLLNELERLGQDL